MMKTSFTILMCLMISIVGISREKRKDAPVVALASRMDCLYFKVDAKMIGATVEVVNEAGEILMTSVITKRHTLVDFYYQQPGSYLIKIRKEAEEEVLEYKKESASPFIPLTPEGVIVY